VLRVTPDETSTDPLTMACYPLLPFVGRIGFGKFRFEGREVTLPPHPISAPHALHGLGWQRMWQVEQVDEQSAVLTLEHDGASDWPWRFSAKQKFALDERGLTITLAMTNRSDTAMPGGLGLHPFFPDRQKARLTGDLPHIWEGSADGLPFRRSDVSAVHNFTRGRRIAPLTLDNCFSGGKDPLDIGWEDRSLRVTLHGADGRRAADHTVVYTPQMEDFFCVEPVSHVPNAVNHADDSAINGFRRLASGESMELACRFEVSGLG
jgi:aldose 1-epimerase